MNDYISVHQIVKKYLKENGYDGLCNRGIECCCYVSEELFTCEYGYTSECKAGYKHIKGYGYPEIRLEKPE